MIEEATVRENLPTAPVCTGDPHPEMATAQAGKKEERM